MTCAADVHADLRRRRPDVDLRELLAFHESHGRLATVTAVRPPSRFGALGLDGDKRRRLLGEAPGGEGWINGGFFIFERAVLDHLTDDATVLEREPLEALARDGQLMAYRHDGFWEPMDTERDVATWSTCGPRAWRRGRSGMMT